MHYSLYHHNWGYSQFDGLVQDCSNSIANALELLQSCTKPLSYNNIESAYLSHGMTIILLSHWLIDSIKVTS